MTVTDQVSITLNPSDSDDTLIRNLRIRLAEANNQFEKDYIIAQLKLLEAYTEDQTLLVE